jgi:hypothetical protein
MEEENFTNDTLNFTFENKSFSPPPNWTYLPNEGVIRLSIDSSFDEAGNETLTHRYWCDYYFWENIYKTQTTTTTTEFIMTSTTTTTTTRPTTTTTTTTAYVPLYIPPADRTCFQDLSGQNQDMVKKLGYQIQTWHGCKVPGCPWPDGVPKPGASCMERRMYLDYNRNATAFPWFSLTKERRLAWMYLGFDEQGNLWGDGALSRVFSLRWDKLTVEQRKRAKFLGYDEHSWQRCETGGTGSGKTSCLERLRYLEKQTWMKDWQSFSTGVRDILESLGWTQERWEEDNFPRIFEEPWETLPYEIKTAAILLGHGYDTWANCINAPCLERYQYVKDKFMDVKWYQMSKATKLNLKMLGWSEDLWDTGGNAESLQMQWEELAIEQQAAAMFLGHTRETWQGCAEWQDPQSTVPPVTKKPKDPNRAIRARMVIHRPFTEISGNLQGNGVPRRGDDGVASPSFVIVFERSVARAIFCRNPWVEDDGTNYTNNDGSPKCIAQDLLEQSQHRVKTIRVVKGSIIADFIIEANNTPDEPTSAECLLDLSRQLRNVRSPACRDIEFGRFAEVADVFELEVPESEAQRQEEVLQFEKTRKQYNSGNACQLHSDVKNGKNACVSGTQRARRPALLVLGIVVMLAVFVVGKDEY